MDFLGNNGDLTTIMVCNVFFSWRYTGDIRSDVLKHGLGDPAGGYFLGPDMGHICTQFGYMKSVERNQLNQWDITWDINQLYIYCIYIYIHTRYIAYHDN
jgi:hypothetical protein